MSAARIGDIERRLGKLIQPGTVVEADYKLARVRVAVGKNVSDWLPWLTGRAGEDKTWHPPEIGEQVLMVSPSGNSESGFILPGGIYKNDYPANGDTAEVSRTTFKDGAIYEYDRENHARLISLPEGKSTVKVGEKSVSEITETKITHKLGDSAKVEIEETAVRLTVGGMGIEITAAGISITGPVTQTGGNMTSDGIGLQTHKHTGVTIGVQTSAGPVP